MESLDPADLRKLLDDVHALGQCESMDALPRLVARLAWELIPCDRAGWVVIDLSGGFLEGVHWPAATTLLQRLPRDLSEVPLIPQITSRVNSDTLRISDVWSRREWHNKKIYSELYGPNGGEYQMVLPLSFATPGSAGTTGRRVESLTLIRKDSDFSERDRTALSELGRHVRNTMRNLRRAATPTAAVATRFGLTARQGEALLAMADGSSVRHAAQRLGVAPKTLENHLQAAYARLGVSNRTAALSRLSGVHDQSFGVGEIPH